MDLLTLLDMVAVGMGDRVLIGGRTDGLTGSALKSRVLSGQGLLANMRAKTVIHIAGNSNVFPIALFSAAAAGVPFLPLNYRLSDEQIGTVLARHKSAVVISDTPGRVRGLAPDIPVLSLDQFIDEAAHAPHQGEMPAVDPDEIAVLLMTSGTTAEPKTAVLRHRHLTSYILGSVDFASATALESSIVSAPPYHIAAVANLLSNLYAGRRVVYLGNFTAKEWLHIVRTEEITNAMVVPTMLTRIVDELVQAGTPAPSSLRSLAYGGAKAGQHLIANAMRLFPETDFVNAYGLTETSSSVTILGPGDHRDAQNSSDPHVRRRLGSTGRPLPNIRIEIRDDDGRSCEPGVVGNIMVSGPQVAAEYLHGGSSVDTTGWFATRDQGYLDEDGYLFVLGRVDDTIIRGAENIAPAEIEEVIADHDSVLECAVVGLPDEEWGQRIAAFVVIRPGATLDADELKVFVRRRLRGSKTPDEVRFLDELPITPTGKVLRRNLVSMFA